MDNQILIALISKDISELNQIFSENTSLGALSPEYLRLAKYKAHCLVDNIDALQQSFSAENIDCAPSSAGPTFDVEQLNTIIDEKIAAILTQFNQSPRHEELEPRLADFEATLTDRIAALVQQRIADLQQHNASSNSRIDAKFQSIFNQISALVADFAETSAMLNSKVSQLEDAVCRIQTVAPAPVAVEPTPAPVIVETVPVAEETATESASIPEPVDPMHHPTSTIAEITNAAGVATVADSIHSRQSIIDKLSHREDNSLASSLNNKKIDDLKAAISIADRFRFQRELFNGDGERMNKSISAFNSFSTMQEAEEFIGKTLKWSEDNPTVVDFLHLLQRRYL